jgi:transposase
MDSLYYVGIDVHKKSWVVTAVHQGEQIFRHRQDPSVEILIGVLGRRGIAPERVRIVYEVGPTGFWLYDALTELGYEVMVVSPAQVPRAAGEKVKTDFRDSRQLASKLASGVLRGIDVPTPQERAVRDLVRTRRQLVKQCSSLLRMLKSKLLFANIPYAGRRWGPRFREYVLSQEVLLEHQLSICHVVGAIDALEGQIRQIERDLDEVFARSEYRDKMTLLQSVPGIGPQTSRSILAELRDVNRFPRPDQLASYLGLTPSEYSSGESVRRGRITRQGNAHLRAALVEASWVAARHDEKLGRFYRRLAWRIGKKRATVAVARKMAVIIHRMLQTGEFYRKEAEEEA